jgi:hypothetical protein
MYLELTQIKGFSNGPLFVKTNYLLNIEFIAIN